MAKKKAAATTAPLQPLEEKPTVEEAPKPKPVAAPPPPPPSPAVPIGQPWFQFCPHCHAPSDFLVDFPSGGGIGRRICEACGKSELWKNLTKGND